VDILRPEQIITVAAFLGLLLLAAALLRAKGGALKSRLTAGRRMDVTEVASLGPSDRAVLLRIDGREFLVLTSKRGTPQALPLGDMPAPRGPEATA
jgi:flagellar protein FliO/FliZ